MEVGTIYETIRYISPCYDVEGIISLKEYQFTYKLFEKNFYRLPYNCKVVSRCKITKTK